jgi:cytochrome b561
MPSRYAQFPAFSRLLHWTMAAMILTMLCIGIAMVVSLGDYHVLLAIHRPLGVAVLILAVVGAILFHTLIVRDGMLKRMVPWNIAGTSARVPR